MSTDWCIPTFYIMILRNSHLVTFLGSHPFLPCSTKCYCLFFPFVTFSYFVFQVSILTFHPHLWILYFSLCCFRSTKRSYLLGITLSILFSMAILFGIMVLIINNVLVIYKPGADFSVELQILNSTIFWIPQPEVFAITSKSIFLKWTHHHSSQTSASHYVLMPYT